MCIWQVFNTFSSFFLIDIVATLILFPKLEKFLGKDEVLVESLRRKGWYGRESTNRAPEVSTWACSWLMSVSFVRTPAFQSSFSPNLWIAKHGPFSSAFHRSLLDSLQAISLSSFQKFPLLHLILLFFHSLIPCFGCFQLSCQYSPTVSCGLFFFFNCNLCYLGVSPLVGSCPLKGFFFFLQEKLGWILFTALCSFL